MTSGPIVRQVVLFCLPLMLGNIFQMLYNTVDSVVVGNFVGTEALAAVGATTIIVNMLVFFFNGFATGASVVIGRYFGARDMEQLHKSVETTMAATFLLSLFFTVGGVLAVEPMLKFMSTPEDVFPQAAIYLRIYNAGCSGFLIYNMGSGLLRAVGDTTRPLYFLILTSALNIGLDLLFIVPFKMGILGAALATDISQAISGVVSFGFLCRKFEVLHMQKGELAFSKRACIRLMGIGVPMGLQCSITAIGSVIMQWAVNVLGSTAVAAVTAASRNSRHTKARTGLCT